MTVSVPVGFEKCPLCESVLEETWSDTSGRLKGYRYACYTTVWVGGDWVPAPPNGLRVTEGVPCLRRLVEQATARAKQLEVAVRELVEALEIAIRLADTPDGTTATTWPEWSEQRRHVLAVLERYQGGRANDGERG